MLCLYYVMLYLQVEVLHCDSAVQCFVCVTTNHQSDRDVLAVLAATERGHLVTWKLELCHDGNTVSARRMNRLALHVPNPVLNLVSTVDGTSLASGCCFMMFDVASKLSIRRSARGAVKVWRTSDLLDGPIDEDISPVCTKTTGQLFIRARHTNEAHRPRTSPVGARSFGIRGLAFTPDGGKLAVGFGYPTGCPLRLEPDVLSLCCAETLAVLWTMRENNFNVCDLRFSRKGTGGRRSPWQLVVSTERSIGKVAIYHRHQRRKY